MESNTVENGIRGKIEGLKEHWLGASSTKNSTDKSNRESRTSALFTVKMLLKRLILDDTFLGPLLLYVAYYCRILHHSIFPEKVEVKRQPKLTPEEHVAETTAMFSDLLESLKRPIIVEDEAFLVPEYDPVSSLEEELKQILEDVESQAPTIQLKASKPTANIGRTFEEKNNQQPGPSNDVQITEPISPEISEVSDQDGYEDELVMEFQRKLLDQSQKHREEMEALREKRKCEQKKVPKS